ncbi:hypothetical protein [Lysinibacillus xylanilyticus]|uniref:PD-(D/E)XK endonuclease-like domain-containing protein n=1 Tax=Lysinibacillus xylanilyticus TaxID=582475 RepID=A0ABT4EP70_9BACI|nr:hypothetical protein [Lysinibacillus xylanilyticus]MCY9546813.1 hypothetical protein [Lysinibacillus xylanilyticus]
MNNDALTALYGDNNKRILMDKYEEGAELAQLFQSQFDAYYASPTSSFHDNKIARKFYEQRLRHINFTPYPNDGLVTFGASGTNKCDREIFFKNAKVKVEKTPDIPFRGRQRRVGSAVIEYLQLDIAHMEKRLGNDALFTFAIASDGDYAMEDAMQVRQVIEHNGVKFAITVKPDGILNYANDPERRFIFEYKTKASGVVEMNGKLDYNGAQADHLRQVTAEAIVYGINEGFVVYESMHKPSWFSDEERKSIPKTRKTWYNGKPLPDFRAMYFYITDEMKNELLDDLSRQAELVYNGEIPGMNVEMTSKCGFCPFKSHCKKVLMDVELTRLIEVEKTMSKSNMAGKQEHTNLRNYLAEGV